MSKKIYLFSLVLLALGFRCLQRNGRDVANTITGSARNEAFIDSLANAHANTASR